MSPLNAPTLLPTIIYYYGGCFVSGGFATHDNQLRQLAYYGQCRVIAVQYRLAPEHPYPSARRILAVWDYLMHLGYGARDVIVAGDSAGGNLALSLVLKLKEQKRILPRGLILFSPWTDLTGSGKSYETKVDVDPILNREYLDNAIAAYASGQDLKNPLISPLFGNFTGFPPTYIQVGSNELLLSDSLLLKKSGKIPCPSTS